MNDLGTPAPVTTAKPRFSIPERLLLTSGAISTLVLILTALRGS